MSIVVPSLFLCSQWLRPIRMAAGMDAEDSPAEDEVSEKWQQAECIWGSSQDKSQPAVNVGAANTKSVSTVASMFRIRMK